MHVAKSFPLSGRWNMYLNLFNTDCFESNEFLF